MRTCSSSVRISRWRGRAGAPASCGPRTILSSVHASAAATSAADPRRGRQRHSRGRGRAAIASPPSRWRSAAAMAVPAPDACTAGPVVPLRRGSRSPASCAVRPCGERARPRRQRAIMVARFRETPAVRIRVVCAAGTRKAGAVFRCPGARSLLIGLRRAGGRPPPGCTGAPAPRRRPGPGSGPPRALGRSLLPGRAPAAASWPVIPASAISARPPPAGPCRRSPRLW